MTRIIAGSAGGRTLRTPRGRDTRPTTDRVREALFSRVEALMDLDGARVLDLYAGSGALGLEALSRGAAHLLAVERHRPTARLVETNARDLGLADRVVVLAAPVEAVLEAGPSGDTDPSGTEQDVAEQDLAEQNVAEPGSTEPPGDGEPGGTAYHLVLADPPYPVGEEELTGVLAALVDHGWLDPEALVVLERSARSPEPTWPAGLTHLGTRTYGETALHLAEPSG